MSLIAAPLPRGLRRHQTAGRGLSRLPRGSGRWWPLGAPRVERTAAREETGGPVGLATRLAPVGEEAARGWWRSGFAQGFFINVLNPEAALFFLNVLPQSVNGSASTAQQAFLPAALGILIGVVHWLVLVPAAARLRTLLAPPKTCHRWQSATGWLFVVLGIDVAATARPAGWGRLFSWRHACTHPGRGHNGGAPAFKSVESRESPTGPGLPCHRRRSCQR
ncbi:LysE family translocator [Streptomyces actinomycinicus]